MQLVNKDAIAHEIIQFEAVDNVEKVVSQLRQGLASTGVLDVMRAFPEAFVEMLTFTRDPTAQDVLEALYVDENETVYAENDTVILAWIHKYIEESDTEGILLQT